MLSQLYRNFVYNKKFSFGPEISAIQLKTENDGENFYFVLESMLYHSVAIKGQ
jgi:hypothetical protein